MKGFVLDSTYRDAVIINANDEFSTVPVHTFPNNPISKYEINLNQLSNTHISHKTKNDNFNKFNFINYI